MVWTDLDKELLEGAEFVYDPAQYFYFWQHSEIKYGCSVEIKKPERGYNDGYVVDMSCKSPKRHSRKYFRELSAALMEAGRWQGRYQNQKLVKKNLEIVTQTIEGSLPFAFND